MKCGILVAKLLKKNWKVMDRIIEKKKFTPKKIALYASGTVFLLFTLYVFVFSDQSKKINTEKDRITISEVKSGKFQDYIPISGTVEPIQTFYLDLTEGGKVVEKYVIEGTMLKAGDAIIKLDNPNLALQVMNSQSNFLLAESQLRLTRVTFEQNKLYKQTQLLDLEKNLLYEKRNFETEKELFKKGLTSKNKYESAKDQYEFLLKSRELMQELLKKDSLTNIQMVQQSEASIRQNKEYLRIIENQLSNLTVRAPISGQLSALNAEIGQSVGGGYRLGQIDNIDSYKIKAEIDEHYIARVKPGLRGVYEFNGKEFILEIKTVFPQVTNGRFSVDMNFIGQAPKEIRRGQSVHIRLDLGGESDALLIEAGAFYNSTGGQYIFVVNSNGSEAVKRDIKIGRQNPQFYEVLDGLNPGEKVITSSYSNFGDAEKVILK